MTKILLRRIAVVTFLAIAALGASAAPASADEPAQDPSTAHFEMKFLVDMIDHHAMAVEMAEICLDKAVHEDLRATCENIRASQSQQIEQMQSWLSDWYGTTHEPAMTQGDMQMMERLGSLDGADFEIEFMESMIKHHRKAIREGESCLRRAEHEQLLTLCQNIISTQSAEIAQMEQWLCDWYGRCAGRREAA